MPMISRNSGLEMPLLTQRQAVGSWDGDPGGLAAEPRPGLCAVLPPRGSGGARLGFNTPGTSETEKQMQPCDEADTPG